MTCRKITAHDGGINVVESAGNNVLTERDSENETDEYLACPGSTHILLETGERLLLETGYSLMTENPVVA